jgi:thioredoxin 1
MEVLRFTATWCQPCKALAQQLEELGLDKNVTVIDIDEQQDLAIQYGVRGVPTLVALDERNKEVKRMVGVKAKDIILDWFPKQTENNNIIKSNN